MPEPSSDDRRSKPTRRAAAAGLGAAAIASFVAFTRRSDGEPSDAAGQTNAAGQATTAERPSTPAAAPPELPDRGLHPPLESDGPWLQSSVNSLEELRGSVVALQFWTFACSNCRATMPHMRALYDSAHPRGLEIVGVHAPEFDFEAEVDAIVEAAADLGVVWPIALDTEKRAFHSWQEGTRSFWPRIYLIDRRGHIRYDHIGEGRYAEIAAGVEALLAEPAV